MSRSLANSASSVPPLTTVDQICDRFEAAWKKSVDTGARPVVDDYLCETTEPVRSELLRYLLAVEWEYRYQYGEQPTKDEYLHDNETMINAQWRKIDTEPDSQTTKQVGRGRSVESSPLFGDYEILEEVGRGGMGVVYRARHLKLRRDVALKMILSGRLANTGELLRFRTEAEAAARLQHPNIVAVYDFDEVDGNHYLTMEFIQGHSLAQLVAQGPLPSKTAARYLRQIARAMHHAHLQGILHRDMKPSNILIDAHDEVHITDFGLAKRMHLEPDDEVHITDFGPAKRMHLEPGDVGQTRTGDGAAGPAGSAQGES
jgi:serine/threonine-protein kinase